MRARTFRTALTVTALLATTTVGATAGSASASPKPAAGKCTPTWKIVETPPVPAGSDGAGMEGPAVASGSDVWFPGVAYGAGGGPWMLHSEGGPVTVGTPLPATPRGYVDPNPWPSSFDSSGSGWVVTQARFNTSEIQVAQRWHDGRWTTTPLAVSPSAATKNVQVNGIESVSANDAWAVGAYYEPPALFTSIGAYIQHWDGTEWTVVPNPVQDRGAYLLAVTAVSANDVWAVGGQDGTGGRVFPLIEHWDGTEWTVVPTSAAPGAAALYGVSGTGPNDVWAVGAQPMAGTDNVAVPLIEHWDGTEWTVLPELPDVGNAKLTDVYAASPTDVWATEETPLLPGTVEKFLHWDGKTWTAVDRPGPVKYDQASHFVGIDGSGPNDIWASGFLKNNLNNSRFAQIAHLSCEKG